MSDYLDHARRHAPGGSDPIEAAGVDMPWFFATCTTTLTTIPGGAETFWEWNGTFSATDSLVTRAANFKSFTLSEGVWCVSVSAGINLNGITETANTMYKVDTRLTSSSGTPYFADRSQLYYTALNGWGFTATWNPSHFRTICGIFTSNGSTAVSVRTDHSLSSTLTILNSSIIRGFRFTSLNNL